MAGDALIPESSLIPSPPSGSPFAFSSFVEIRQRNNEIRWMLSDYLSRTPRFITQALMQEINPDGLLQEEVAYYSLLSAALGLDPEENPKDRCLAQEWLRPGLKKLDTRTYTDNPYYRNIRIPEATVGNWTFKQERYAPYELFVCNDLLMQDDFKEIVRVGYFDEAFCFPAVLENDHEWMAVKPNEIETMQPALDAIHGNVVTFGLGLGYFAYMASLKETVDHLCIVERDPQVIRLFTQHILPQFGNKAKIELVEADAFEYAEHQMAGKTYDFAFVDLWHDASDGVVLYLRMKALESRCASTRFLYWIEDSLLSGLRWQRFDEVIRTARSQAEFEHALGVPSLKAEIS